MHSVKVSKVKIYPYLIPLLEKYEKEINEIKQVIRSNNKKWWCRQKVNYEYYFNLKKIRSNLKNVLSEVENSCVDYVEIASGDMVNLFGEPNLDLDLVEETKSQSDAERFIEYVYGKFDYKKVVDERLTPPLPYEHHLKAQGFGPR